MIKTDMKCPVCGRYLWGLLTGTAYEENEIIDEWLGDCDCGKHYEWSEVYTFERKKVEWFREVENDVEEDYEYE